MHTKHSDDYCLPTKTSYGTVKHDVELPSLQTKYSDNYHLSTVPSSVVKHSGNWRIGHLSGTDMYAHTSISDSDLLLG